MTLNYDFYGIISNGRIICPLQGYLLRMRKYPLDFGERTHWIHTPLDI